MTNQRLLPTNTLNYKFSNSNQNIIIQTFKCKSIFQQSLTFCAVFCLFVFRNLSQAHVNANFTFVLKLIRNNKVYYSLFSDILRKVIFEIRSIFHSSFSLEISRYTSVYKLADQRVSWCTLC